MAFIKRRTESDKAGSPKTVKSVEEVTTSLADERKTALREGRQKRTEELAELRSNKLTIDGIAVYRLDSYSWCTENKGVQHYWPTQILAIQDMYKMLVAVKSTHTRSVDGLIKVFEQCEKRLLEAVKKYTEEK